MTPYVRPSVGGKVIFYHGQFEEKVRETMLRHTKLSTFGVKSCETIFVDGLI